MPKGYVIGRSVVTNADAWAQYAAKATEAIRHTAARRSCAAAASRWSKARAAPATW